jgi:hypothetical protein
MVGIWGSISAINREEGAIGCARCAGGVGRELLRCCGREMKLSTLLGGGVVANEFGSGSPVGERSNTRSLSHSIAQSQLE